MKTLPLQKLLTVGALAMLVAALTGCTTVPVTGRSQLNLLTPGQEMQLGLTSFTELKKNTPVSKDTAVNAMIQRVGQRIAAVAQADMPGAQWEFVVFESKEVNAFCLPGGKVGVYTGILPITKDESGMATVLGHEIAHAVARHGGERMTEAMLLQTGGELLNASLANSDPRWKAVAGLAYGVTTQVGVALPHSRGHESEADHIGLRYMARAGYEPEAAVAFWQRFAAFNAQQQGQAMPAFLRTHPTDEARVKQLRELLPVAKAEFQPAK